MCLHRGFSPESVGRIRGSVGSTVSKGRTRGSFPASVPSAVWARRGTVQTTRAFPRLTRVAIAFPESPSHLVRCVGQV